jgi:hypothetical protein
MHKNATKCNETLNKWCKNKHGASKIIDTLETYQPAMGVKVEVKQESTPEVKVEVKDEAAPEVKV